MVSVNRRSQQGSRSIQSNEILVKRSPDDSSLRKRNEEPQKLGAATILYDEWRFRAYQDIISELNEFFKTKESSLKAINDAEESYTAPAELAHSTPMDKAMLESEYHYHFGLIHDSIMKYVETFDRVAQNGRQVRKTDQVYVNARMNEAYSTLKMHLNALREEYFIKTDPERLMKLEETISSFVTLHHGHLA
jgi:hypothetical protein